MFICLVGCFAILTKYVGKMENKINSCVIPNSLEDLGRILASWPGTSWNLISHLHQNPLDLIRFLPRNPPEPCLLFAPKISYLPGNSLEPHQPSAPEPSGTSSAICTGTLRNLISHLHRNPPEPHQPSAPEPSGTSSAICAGTPRNPPEPSGTFSGTCCCSCTGSHQSYSGLKTP